MEIRSGFFFQERKYLSPIFGNPNAQPIENVEEHLFSLSAREQLHLNTQSRVKVKHMYSSFESVRLTAR